MCLQVYILTFRESRVIRKLSQLVGRWIIATLLPADRMYSTKKIRQQNRLTSATRLYLVV